jgi:hypothetical protein
MENQELENKLIINTTFILDNEIEVTIKNINIEELSKLNNGVILELIMDTKWYMYGNYDVVQILNNSYVITNKTKKKIELIRYNSKK